MRSKIAAVVALVGTIAIVGAGAATYPNSGFMAIELNGIDQFEIYHSDSFEVTDSGGPVTVTQAGNWLTLTAPRTTDVQVRIGMPDVFTIRANGSSGTVSGFALDHDLTLVANNGSVELDSSAEKMSIYADEAAVSVTGGAAAIAISGTASDITVKDFDGILADVTLSESSVGRVDGIGAELHYLVQDDSQLYYSADTKISRMRFVAEDATVSEF